MGGKCKRELVSARRDPRWVVAEALSNDGVQSARRFRAPLAAWHLAVNESMEDHADCADVRFCIPREVFSTRRGDSEAENLDARRAIGPKDEKKVLEPQIAMHDSKRVCLGDGFERLLDETDRGGRRQRAA